MITRTTSNFENLTPDLFGLAAVGLGFCLLAGAAADHDSKVNTVAQICHDMCKIKEEGLKEFFSKVDSTSVDYRIDSAKDVDRYAASELQSMHQIKNGSAENIIFNVLRLEAVLIALTRRNQALSLNIGNNDKPFKYVSPIRLFAVMHDWMYQELILHGDSTNLTKSCLDPATTTKLNMINVEIEGFVDAFVHELFDLDVDRVESALQNVSNVPFLHNVKYIENASHSAIVPAPVDEKFIRNEEDQELFQESFSKIQEYIEQNYGKKTRADTIKEALNLMFGLMQTYKDQNELKQSLHVIETNYGLA